MPLQELLDDVAQYVEHEIEEGVETIEVAPDLLADLNRPAAPGEQPPPERGATPATPEARELAEIVKAVSSCTQCSLHETRTRTVPGQGALRPDIVFVGEAPGADEDRQGLAFVGAAGQLLTKMIQAMGYARDQVFIGNVLKCRPPGNRTPLPHEMETCLPYLKAQIAVLRPKVIIALGATAMRGLLDLTSGITKLRGKWLSFEGIDLMPTYHPAYLLRSPSAKRDVWEDLKEVLRRLGKEPPPTRPKGQSRRG